MSSEGFVTALKLPANKPLREETERYFEVCMEKLGLVPNVLLAYAFDENKLEVFTKMYNELMLGDSGLSKLEREMIAVTVSSVNKCYYCLTAHGAAVRELSGDPILGEQLVMNYHVANLKEREKVMLEFCVKLTKNSSEIIEADREKLREVGFTDQDIWDIIAVASFFNMTNRVASATAMRPNDEYHSKAR